MSLDTYVNILHVGVTCVPHVRFIQSNTCELRPTCSDGKLGAKPVRKFKPPNSDGNLARSLCASPGRPDSDINLGAKPVCDPKPPNSHVNLGANPVAGVQTDYVTQM